MEPADTNAEFRSKSTYNRCTPNEAELRSGTGADSSSIIRDSYNKLMSNDLRVRFELDPPTVANRIGNGNENKAWSESGDRDSIENKACMNM